MVMSRFRQVPLPVLFGLLLFAAIAGALIFFGLRMALYRADQRAIAEPMDAVVVSVDSRIVESTDSDGDRTTSTEYAFVVEFETNGEEMRRPVVAANFEAESVWFSVDEVDPDDFAKGNVVEILVRPDLDYAVTPAGFWAANMVPIFLTAFGGFILVFLSFWSYGAFR